MLGFKNFENATVTISGIELAQKIRKQQFDTSAVTGSAEMSVAQILEVVLAA
jgi:transposase-like protein